MAEIEEWHLEHPKATLQEVPAAADERLAELRMHRPQNAALASQAADALACFLYSVMVSEAIGDARGMALHSVPNGCVSTSTGPSPQALESSPLQDYREH